MGWGRRPCWQPSVPHPDPVSSTRPGMTPQGTWGTPWAEGGLPGSLEPAPAKESQMGKGTGDRLPPPPPTGMHPRHSLRSQGFRPGRVSTYLVLTPRPRLWLEGSPGLISSTDGGVRNPDAASPCVEGGVTARTQV